MKNIVNVILLLVTTCAIAKNPNYAQSAASFEQNSKATNSTISDLATKLNADPKNDNLRKQLDDKVNQKKALGKASRPQALTLVDRVRMFTARALERKIRAHQLTPGQPVTLSPAEVQEIQRLARIAQNQRG